MRDDLKSAFRQMGRNPSFTAAVILTLGLGVGAVTAVLTLADPMLFRPLPFTGADRIFVVGAGDDRLHGPDVIRAETLHQGFSALGDFDLTDSGRIGDASERSISYAVSRGFLPALGVRPIIGRGFRDDEHVEGRQPDVALITYGLWQSTFGGARDVVGRRVSFSGPRGHSYAVIGVLPREFFFPDAINQQPAVLIPGALDSKETAANFVLSPIARLRDGVSVAAATAEMQAIVTNVEREFPSYERGRRVELIPLREALFGRVRTPLLMLLATTGCVLLLATANLAQLVMARLRARRREVGIRLAIGASRTRVARQLIVEMLVLSTAGAATALAIGGGLSRLLVAYMPPLLRTYRLLPATLDWRVGSLALLLVAAAAVFAGLVPALRITGTEVRATLQPGAAVDGSRRPLRPDSILIFAQAAVGVALLVTGLLIVRSFATLVSRPLGFSPDRVRTIGLELPAGASLAATEQARRQVYEALKPRMHVALVDGIPGMTLNTAVSRPDADVTGKAVLGWPVSGTFFDVFGLRLVRGRLFTDQEAFSNAPVAVIDQRAAHLLWPDADPIGRSVKELDGTVRTVVGVVQTVRSDFLGTGFQRGGAFLPFSKSRSFFLTYRVDRADVPIADLTALAGSVAPGVRVTSRPLELFERQLGQPRFLALLLGSLAALAVILTFVGVLSVVSHEVVRRTKEIGIRMALGADASRIRRLVLSGALVPAFLGGLLGLSGSLWFTESLRSLLYDLNPHDPLVYIATLTLMLGTVAVGSFAPAWRASRTDPMIPLRAD